MVELLSYFQVILPVLDDALEIFVYRKEGELTCNQRRASLGAVCAGMHEAVV